MGIKNPYLAAFKSVEQLVIDLTCVEGPISTLDMRQMLVNCFSWAIPNDEALYTIRTFSPVIEIGAGTGYWAWCLKQIGCDIICYDKRALTGEEGNTLMDSPKEIAKQLENGCKYRFINTWAYVRQGGPEAIKMHTERYLMLCWPDLNTQFAKDCLSTYNDCGGEYFIYIGEGNGGCTGDPNFFELLNTHWEEIKLIDIPQWPGMNDYLMVYKRR